MDRALVQALRGRGVDIITVFEAGTEGQIDEDQLNWATSQNRVLYSHNISDFCRLHSAILSEGKIHAGIALLEQGYSVGEQLKCLSRLIVAKTAEDMQNQLEFINKYLREE